MARERKSDVRGFLESTRSPQDDAGRRTPARALLGAVDKTELVAAGLSAEGEPEVTVEVEADNGARKNDRRPFTARVQLSAAIAGINAETQTTNVSSGGVFIETTRLLEVGDPLVLTFKDDEGGILVGGRVRWVTPFGTIDDPRPGMGVEFTGLDDKKRARLRVVLGLDG